ncbi:uncharacterized protein K444DRAFT_699078 [Hyaloscypha bicolor E]|uniref:Catechol dioxygenase N-terminal domain-containing protein n=1 Tax=Hyaloscypha bicolor E TaxID=1095630 RepID=A0A2J6SU90_9HELO|nr:uncharacterized protein K444DRAFT_699078 [Hyaloscypha bicolor E]PMD54348.1 hypothetical protein K444DRAFT_699078 [Hyaloscypha bicolor E]
MMVMQFANHVAQMSTSTRHQGHRISDALGLESLVDEIAHKLLIDGANPTSSSILGPFWSPKRSVPRTRRQHQPRSSTR